ncbi:MRP-like NifH superfamily NTPase [Syntrophotalea carbinolica DSM 2380]|uniref:Iron-sulfur cluster carrier protein n=1 Tax=Syntrophotalea carbinolica (strain DSM 2380 / NBRC 103641 / GraBd1) TaxID=338963 RepID=Q3A6K3_SYNC1|nr:Mrp/NBP35 family ATP-binding protein [Syntrophotalea carbinolica]ABA88004.1 MRP-like NifH superfamily NTPase [Syntrophotalea carbinolica DSM 2380]
MSSCTSSVETPSDQPSACELKAKMKQRLDRIKRKILVMSGKGGVGKSSTAVNLALALAQDGYAVGLLDIDLHGPSVPKMLGLDDSQLQNGPDGLLPVEYLHNMKVISVGFLLGGAEEALMWRGPAKTGLIQQFLRDVEWGDLDFLIVDCPPGTGDEPMTAVQTLLDGTQSSGAVIVTTPQEVALLDVQKSITFCRHLEMPVLGIIENMSGFACPKCGEVVDIFKSGGGQQIAERMKAPFLGKIPMDPAMVMAGDSGKPYIAIQGDSATSETYRKIAASFMQDIDK